VVVYDWKLVIVSFFSTWCYADVLVFLNGGELHICRKAKFYQFDKKGTLSMEREGCWPSQDSRTQVNQESLPSHVIK